MQFMEQAIQLAYKGLGKVSPNPMVGAVIVKKGQVVATGYHQQYGGLHAEANAIKNAHDEGIKIEGTTMYVTLEPCNHYGKTPPCSKAIIEAGIDKVVIGHLDPNNQVAGGGKEALEEAGVEVEVIEDETLLEKLRELYEDFDKYSTSNEVFVVGKFATSLDGKIATYTGESKWITGEKARSHGHQLRKRYEAILVGIETVLADNPSLTVREEGQELPKWFQPLRVVLDSKGRIPLECQLVQTSGTHKTLVFTTEQMGQQKKEELEAKEVEVVVLDADPNGRVSIKEAMMELRKRKIASLLIEGGGQVLFSAIEQGCLHKLVGYVAPIIIGGKSAPTAFSGNGFSSLTDCPSIQFKSTTPIGKDLLIQAYVEE